MSGVAHDPAALDLSLDDSHRGLMALLPTGAAWPRDPTGTLSRTVRGLAGVHWGAWIRVRDLLEEADPRTTTELIDMWETDCGLPDPCVTVPPTTIEARRAAVIARRQEGGTTTPMDFITLAAILGYEIEIKEFRPFRTWSHCMDFLNPDSAAWAHSWLVTIISGQSVGDLECLFERIKPAHTQIIWAYVAPPLVYWDQALGGGSTWDAGASVWDGMPYP